MNDPYSAYDDRETLTECFTSLLRGKEVLNKEVCSCMFKTYADGSTVALAPCGTIVAYAKANGDLYTVKPSNIPDFIIKPMREAIKQVAKETGVGWRLLTKERTLQQLIGMQADREFYEQFISEKAT